MDRRFPFRLAAVAATAAVACALTATPAAAHVLKSFGPYSVALGWAHEPAYDGVQNAVQAIVKDAQGHAVGDLNSGDLTVQVTVGSQTSDALKLDPAFDPDTGLGTPGDYEAPLIPTAVGDYTFHLHGTIHGTAVDETATSGEKTFDSVTDPADAQFPNHVPASGDLSTKLGRVGDRADAAQSAAQSASDSAGRATLLAVIALVIALVLGGGAAALAWRRRA